jgi:hypothetical protein
MKCVAEAEDEENELIIKPYLIVLIVGGVVEGGCITGAQQKPQTHCQHASRSSQRHDLVCEQGRNVETGKNA